MVRRLTNAVLLTSNKDFLIKDLLIDEKHNHQEEAKDKEHLEFHQTALSHLTHHQSAVLKNNQKFMS